MNTLRVLLTPSCWVRNYPTNRVLTKWINEELDSGAVPRPIGSHHFKLSGTVFWAANYPYAYGHIDNDSSGMPDRKTVFRLYEAAMQEKLNAAKSVAKDQP